MEAGSNTPRKLQTFQESQTLRHLSARSSSESGTDATKPRSPRASRVSHVQPGVWLQSWQWLQWFSTEESPPSGIQMYRVGFFLGFLLQVIACCSCTSWSNWILVSNFRSCSTKIPCHLIRCVLSQHVRCSSVTDVTPSPGIRTNTGGSTGRLWWVQLTRDNQTNKTKKVGRYPEAGTGTRWDPFFNKTNTARSDSERPSGAETSPALSHTFPDVIPASDCERAEDDWWFTSVRAEGHRPQSLSFHILHPPGYTPPLKQGTDQRDVCYKRTVKLGPQGYFIRYVLQS